MTTVNAQPHAGRRARFLQNAVGRQRLCRCRAKGAQDREPASRRVAQEYFDKELTSDHSSPRVRRVCRYILMYARRLYNDEGTHVARDRLADRIREYNGRENRLGASFVGCALLCLFLIESI